MAKNIFFVSMLFLVSVGSVLLNEVSAKTATDTTTPKMRERSRVGAIHGLKLDVENKIDGASQVKDEPLHPSANRSYVLKGVRYQPQKSATSTFKQEGNASWYGKPFHGRKTATGERYDMYQLTAAHKTLPLPSYIKVTNLKNGKEVIVKVNDRGPFHGNRVVDLSYGAAKKLGFVESGTAKVKIERVFPDKKKEEAEKARELIFVTLKAFDNFNQAQSFLKQVNETNKTVTAEQMQIIRENDQYAVRLGPFNEKEKAHKTKESLLISL